MPHHAHQIVSRKVDSIYEYSNILILGQVTDQQDTRPSRSNRGKGGAIAQLQAVSDRIHDVRVQRNKRPCNNLKALQDVPLNQMAPPEKGRQVVTLFYPTSFYSNDSNASIPGSSTSPSCEA
jgi:hypothetical protein